MSVSVICPASTAAVPNPRIVASEWRIPRRRRGSGIAAKHSSTLPPLTRANADACSIKTATEASAAPARGGISTGGGTGGVLTDCTGNGATDSDEGPLTSPCPSGAPLHIPAGHALSDQPVIITYGHRQCPLGTQQRWTPGPTDSYQQ